MIIILTEINSFKDKCGVFGVINHSSASSVTMLGLHALQHRGQESCGIASIDSSSLCVKKYERLVCQTFTEKDISTLSGNIAIGHVRYSTSGEKKTQNTEDCIQPFVCEKNKIALAHNGNLIEYKHLKEELILQNANLKTEVDSEIILQLVIHSQKQTVEEKILDAVSKIKGAFSLVIATENFICAVRDSYGIRPLCVGSIDGATIISSESCAITAVGGVLDREVANGEVLFIYKDGKKKQCFISSNVKEKFCIFEFVYFARPDSLFQNKSVYKVRQNIGKVLFEESAKNNGEIVIPVPDSGIPSAIGYANASGIPFEFGIVRNHYVGRTFIDPTQSKRQNKVQMKHTPNVDIIKGKNIILIDDSIVRGTTSRQIVDMLKKAGANEIHMKIASPPTKFPCFYGIDTPSKEELIANSMSVEETAKFLGVNSLQYISIDGLKKACVGENFCLACFDGDYFV